MSMFAHSSSNSLQQRAAPVSENNDLCLHETRLLCISGLSTQTRALYDILYQEHSVEYGNRRVGTWSSSTRPSQSQNHSQSRRMLSPKTLTFGVDCEFGFGSREWSCSEDKKRYGPRYGEQSATLSRRTMTCPGPNMPTPAQRYHEQESCAMRSSYFTCKDIRSWNIPSIFELLIPHDHSRSSTFREDFMTPSEEVANGRLCYLHNFPLHGT